MVTAVTPELPPKFSRFETTRMSLDKTDSTAATGAYQFNITIELHNTDNKNI